jgi:hypothetical protein
LSGGAERLLDQLDVLVAARAAEDRAAEVVQHDVAQLQAGTLDGLPHPPQVGVLPRRRRVAVPRLHDASFRRVGR